MTNPYESPGSRLEDEDPNPGTKRPIAFVIAAVGAWFAALYWAVLALLMGVSAAIGAASALQVVLPVVLIGLYVVRGLQLFKGDLRAAQRLLWLHGIGGLMAVLSISKGGAVFAVVYGIKLAIHIFGGIAAFVAQKEAPTEVG
jgi:hypothetical protein